MASEHPPLAGAAAVEPTFGPVIDIDEVFPIVAVTDPEPAPASGEAAVEPTRRAPLLAVLAATAAAFAGHAVLATRVASPFMFHDEVGYIGFARLLLGDAPELAGPAYHPGYGLLLAPFAAFSDPTELLHSGHLLNAVFSALVIPLLFVLGRRILGLGAWTSVVAAIAGGITSRSLVQAGMLLPEAAFVFAVVGTGLAVGVAAERGRDRRLPLVVAGLAAGTAYVLHPRGLVVVGASWVALGLAALVGQVPRLRLLLVVVPSVVVVAAGSLLSRWAESEMYPLGARASVATGGDGVERVSGLSVIAAGQVWYLLAVTAGLAGAGVIAGLVLVFRRRTTPGAVVAAYVVVGLIGSLVVASVSSVEIPFRDPPRADQPIYGRYLEQWVPLLVVLVPTLGPRALRWAMLVSATVLTGTGWATWNWYDPPVWDARIAWHNVTGVRLAADQWGSDFIPQVTAAGVAVAVTTVVFVVAFRRRLWAIPAVAMVAVAVGSGVVVATEWSEPSARVWEDRHRLGDPAVATGVPLAVDPGGVLELFYALNLQFWHPEIDVDIVDEIDDTHRLVISRSRPGARARLAGDEPGGDVGVWVTDRSLDDAVEDWPQGQ